MESAEGKEYGGLNVSMPSASKKQACECVYRSHSRLGSMLIFPRPVFVKAKYLSPLSSHPSDHSVDKPMPVKHKVLTLAGVLRGSESENRTAIVV